MKLLTPFLLLFSLTVFAQDSVKPVQQNLTLVKDSAKQTQQMQQNHAAAVDSTKQTQQKLSLIRDTTKQSEQSPMLVMDSAKQSQQKLSLTQDTTKSKPIPEAPEKPVHAEKPILIDKIVGIVGDKVILLSDIELQFHQLKLEQSVFTPDAKCGLLDQMMTNKMYLEQALIDSIKVTDEEIESELDRRIRYFVNMPGMGSEEKLEAYYEKSISQIKDEFRNDIKEQLLSQREQAKIFEDVKITPTEVKDFYNKIPKDSLPYFNAEVEIGQIVVYPKVSIVQKQLAQEKIDGIRERIMKGEDFEKLARIYSEDPGSGEKGGDLGIISRGQMVTEFEAAAYNLQDSMELSPVFETKFGYHIIQLISRKGEKLHVRHILIKPKVTNSDLSAARTRLDSIKQTITKDSLTFAKAVSLYSEDEGTKYQAGTIQNPQTGTGSFEINQLDKAIYFTIEKLKPGEVSDPVLFQTPEGEQAYRILYLKTETKPHKANLTDDFYKIKAAAQAKKQDDSLKKWLASRIMTSYTYVDLNYMNCDAVKKWHKQNDVTEKKYE